MTASTYMGLEPANLRDAANKLRTAANNTDDVYSTAQTALGMSDLEEPLLLSRLRLRSERFREVAGQLNGRADMIEQFLLADLRPPAYLSKAGLDWEEGDPKPADPEAGYAAHGDTGYTSTSGLVDEILELEEAIDAAARRALPDTAINALQSRLDFARARLAERTQQDPDVAINVVLIARADDIGAELADATGAERERLETERFDLVTLIVDRGSDGQTANEREHIVEAIIVQMDEVVTFSQAVRNVSGHMTRREAEAAAIAAVAPFDGDYQAAYEAGAIGVDELYFLAPPNERGTDFFLHANHPDAQPQSYWTDQDVAHYWYYLWWQSHSGADGSPGSWKANTAEAGIAEFGGIPTEVIEQYEEQQGDPCLWGDTFNECVSEAAHVALETGMFLTSFIQGCATLAPGGAVFGTFVPFIGNSAGAALGCLVGGFGAAGIPGTGYDGIGPVLPG